MNKNILGVGVLLLSALPALAMENTINSNMSFNANLGLGANGQEVTMLQNFLYSKGYLTATARGHFGPATRKALITFQTSNGISGTGFMGPKTRVALNSMYTSMTNVNNNTNTNNGSLNGTVNSSTNMNTSNMNTQAGVMVGGSMMLPSRDIVDNAVMANNVTTVVAAVQAAGLVDTLKGAGPFTVFAPDNNAFTKLGVGVADNLLTPNMKTNLTNILTYHVVAGRYTAADIQNGMTLTTVNGQKLTFTKDASGMITINGTAKVLTADVISKNGVTFVIDSVLMPQ